MLTLSRRHEESVRPPRAYHAKFAGRVTPNNGWHPTADTLHFIDLNRAGRRVMPGVRFLLLMRRHTLIFACWWLSAASLTVACRPDPSQGVTAISLRNGGGQTAYWYEYTLRGDGTAEYVGDVSPERRAEPRGGKIMAESPGRVRYHGRVSAEQFRGLSELIARSDFRSMPEGFPGYTDAPMTTTGVAFADGRKEVSDQMGVRGERLAEINRAIEQVAGQIKWEQGVR